MARAGGKDRGLFERPKGSGDWWIRYHDHNGQERREKVGSKSAARELYASRKAQVTRIKKGLEVAPEDRNTKPILFSEFVESCYPELQQFKSWPNMERMAQMWTKGFGSRTLLQVARIAAQEAVRRRQVRLTQGKSPASCNRETAFLKALFSRAVKRGFLERNPLAHLGMLPEDNNRSRILRGDEEQLLEAVMSQDDFEIVVLATQTGIRRGRLFSLPWKHVSFDDGGWLTVEGAKSGSSRQVPMTARVKEILERRFASRRSLWVFPNSKGSNHIDPNNWYNRVWKPALKEAGIEGLTIHDLRRTFASRMSMKGQGGRTLSGLLGHKSSKTTDRYAHLDPEAFRAAIQVLDEPGHQTGLRIVK